MEIRKLGILGALEFTSQIFSDSRGSFQEWINLEKIKQEMGFSFPVIQGNISHSKLGVIRGLHFSSSAKGQDKFVTCISGKVVDVLVDLRLGSPTYLIKDYIELDPTCGKSVYIPTGVGHGFASKEDNTVVCYLLTSGYDPLTEQTIHPFDTELGIEWNTDNSILSTRDQNAYSLAQAKALGFLTYFNNPIDVRLSDNSDH